MEVGCGWRVEVDRCGGRVGGVDGTASCTHPTQPYHGLVHPPHSAVFTSRPDASTCCSATYDLLLTPCYLLLATHCLPFAQALLRERGLTAPKDAMPAEEVSAPAAKKAKAATV